MTGQNERIAELEGRVAARVRAAAPPGWRRADLYCRVTVAVNDVALSVLTGESEIVTPEVLPELVDLVIELRRSHYLTEQGTWFSMRLFVLPDGVRSLYNYDFDPDWNPPIPTDCWRRDQIVMPRDGANQPEWLRDRLEGRAPRYLPDPEPIALNPVEQMELLSDRFSIVLADQAPPLWEKVFGYYQAAGEHVEFPALMVYKADKQMEVWSPPPAAAHLLQRLRAGTHGFQGSTWSRMDFEVLNEDGRVRCRSSFTHDEEPAWNRVPSADDVRRDLERFPRDRVPAWVERVLGGAAEAPSAHSGDGAPPAGIRKARVFDHVGPDGAGPSVSRPAVPDGDAERLVMYLRRAPVVMAARSLAPDQMDASRGDRVPLTFHTDGTWVWSGAVGYYLEHHGVPPEPDLVAHVRALGFQVPEVGDEAMNAANAAISGRPTPPPAPAPAESEPLVRPSPTRAWLSRLARRLEELGVDPGTYRLRDTAEGAWCLVSEEGRWTVFRYDSGERYREAVFEEIGQAAVHLLGSVLLVPARRMPAPPAPAPGAPSIEPMEGEPPLSLFQGREMVELPAGASVDRFGGPTGNLAYAARTPFAQRSLPPDWADRPYHLYRLQRPLRVLSGIAVPWFGQPGGGTAYVFPLPLTDLLADGTIEEVQDS